MQRGVARVSELLALAVLTIGLAASLILTQQKQNPTTKALVSVVSPTPSSTPTPTPTP